MNSLHIEACEPQLKIARFMYAVKHNFASTTMDLTKDSKKSTKQLQGSKKFKIMAQDASNSDTYSAYNTESESNYTEHLPRPPCSSKPTRQHLQPCPNKNQQLINTKCIQGTKPSCIPVPNHTKSSSKTSHLSTLTHQPKPSTSTPETSHLSTSTCLQKPSTSTWSNTETTIKQPTVPATRTSSASTYPQRMRKTPLLPTPPVPARQFYNRNHYNQHISGPSPPRYSAYSAFSRPATLNNYRYYLQPHIPGPYTAFPPYLHQEFFTRPYQQHQQAQEHFFTRPYEQHQQPQGHCTQQPYVPIVILTPCNQLNNVLAHQTNLFKPHQH